MNNDSCDQNHTLCFASKADRTLLDDFASTRMVRSLTGAHPFTGSTAIAPNGVPCIIATASCLEMFRHFDGGKTAVIFWNWDTPFGNIISFSFVAGKGLPMARVFLSADDPIYHAAVSSGRLQFAVSHQGKLSDFHEANFFDEHQAIIPLKSIAHVPENENFLFNHFNLAFWRLVGWPKMHWDEQIKNRPQDCLQVSWSRGAELEISHFKKFLEAYRNEYSENRLPDFVNNEARLARPHLCRLFESLASDSSLYEVLMAASCVLDSPEKTEDIISGIHGLFMSEHKDESILLLARSSLASSFFIHESLHSGLCRPWFNGQENPMRANFMPLDPVFLGWRAENFWVNLDLSFPIDQGLFMTGADVPASKKFISESLSVLRLDGISIDDANDLAQSLLTEALDNRQWSAPWVARVQLNLGGFNYVDIYEFEGEFCCLLRDNEDRYVLAALNIKNGSIYIPDIATLLNNDTIELNYEAMAALGVLLSSVIRDFLVVEERDSVFKKRSRKLHGKPNNTSDALNIIYIPRVNYLSTREMNPAVTAFSAFTQKSAHKVGGHLRQVGKASAEQLVLAHQYGFHIPKGYTFIRPHSRGDTAAQIKRTEYRSRSATKMLYTAIESVSNKKIAWFKFEQDVGLMMKSRGLTVAHISASRNGDGGVDVHAFNAKTDEIFAIQCKCYAIHRKIGPDVVRELAGSLHRYPEGTIGMIVTTSSFTQGARDEALIHGFILMDGKDFVAVVNSIGKYQ